MIDEFRSDLIVCNAGGLSFRPAHALQFRKRICLMGIALSDPDVFAPGGECASVAAGHVRRLLPATAAQTPESRCEVLIFGNGYPDRVAAARALLQRFQTHVYGELWGDYGIPSRGLVFGEESVHILSSAFITVVFPPKTPGGHPIIKPYLFDYPAGGALIATDYLPAVERYFIYGKELIGFESTEELIEKVRYYLDHPEQAEQIRAAGRARVLQEHTATCLAADLPSCGAARRKLYQPRIFLSLRNGSDGDARHYRRSF